MNRVLLVLLLAGLCVAAIRVSGEAAQTSSFAITNVAVIDASGAPHRPGMTVVVTGRRIAALGRTGTVEVPRGARVIDGAGKYLIPGLWDMHVHLSYVGRHALPLFLANGVTGVRDMGGDFAQVAAWRDSIAVGHLLGPRIKAAGPIVESTRWLQFARAAVQQAGGRDEDKLARRVGVDTPEDARRVVDSVAALGADFLKLRNAASREAFFALAAEARRRELPLVGHAPHNVSPEEASNAGQRSFEHEFLPPLDGMTTEARARLFRRFAENGTAFVPTMVANRGYRLLPDSLVLAVIADSTGTREPRRRYVSRELAEDWRVQIGMKQSERPRDWHAYHRSTLRDLREMQSAGVPLLAGTDAAAPLVFPGFSLHEELELLVREGGLTPLQALRSATHNPAEFLALQDSLGTIARGKLADLVLLDANPLDDIRNTQRIRAVVANGRLLERAALDSLLAQARAEVAHR
ncbi:MAG TPA: amidohydrolase family protein [Longimicrobiaceae bacterium]|nr:amidohydrolase family protein [Longimicrobiaceae bacterium]